MTARNYFQSTHGTNGKEGERDENNQIPNHSRIDQVHDVAELLVNGSTAGTCFAQPFGMGYY